LEIEGESLRFAAHFLVLLIVEFSLASSLVLTMSHLASLVRLGKDSADQRLSASRVLTPRSVADVAALFHRSTSIHHAGRILGIDAPRQFAFVGDDLTISVISAPVPSSTDPAVILAMLGDDLFDATPVAFCSSLFDAYASVLVSPTDATTYELPVSSTDLDTLAGPPDAHGNRADPSIARLLFDAGGAAPLAGAVRLFCPLPTGVSIPSSLRLDTADDAFTAACPVFEVWRKGMYHAVLHNDGKSISQGDTLLVGTDIDTAGFGALPIAQDVSPTLELLRPGCSQAAQMRAYWKMIRDDAHLCLGDAHAEADTIVAPGGLGTCGTDTIVTDMATAFATALKDGGTSVSLKDKDTLEGNKLNAAAIRLLFARVEKDGATGDDKTVVPFLTESAEKLFTMSMTRASAEHKQIAEESYAELQSPTGMQITSNAAITLKPDDFFGHFGHTIRNSVWLTDSINSPNSNLKTHLSLLAFAPRKVGSLHYQQMKDADELHSVQLAVEEHSTRRVAKSTELCLDLEVSSRESVVSTCANFRASFLPFIGAEAYQKSILGEGLQALAALCLDQQGRNFFATCSTLPQVPFNALVIGDDYLRHLTMIASRTVLRRGVIDAKAISPQPFLQAKSLLDALLEPLKMVILRNNPGPFRDVPYGLTKWFTPESDQKAETETKKRGTTTNDNRTTKATKVEGDHSGPMSKGFLVWSGKGNPKQLQIFWPKNGEPARLCVFFISRGCYCKHRNCTMHHPRSFGAIPEDARRQLEKEVSVTEGLEFAPGQGPAGTSA
jgi:hypothetical protein